MKRIPIVIFLTALITGMFLLFGKCSSDQVYKPDKTQVVQSEKQISVVDKHYQHAIVSLQRQSDSLQKELTQTQYKLKVLKLKLQQSKFDVVELAKKDTTGISKMQQLNDCDSLKQQVLLFTNWVDSTQTDYEQNIAEFNNLLAVKDSQLVICSTSYTDLKSIADDNLQRERKLTEDLNTAYKQQRKNRIQNKFLAAGFLILTGITTTFLINSRK